MTVYYKSGFIELISLIVVVNKFKLQMCTPAHTRRTHHQKPYSTVRTYYEYNHITAIGSQLYEDKSQIYCFGILLFR